MGAFLDVSIADGVDLSGATLVGATGVTESLLQAAASITGANFSDHDFRGYDVSGLDFTGADLTGVNLLDTDLSAAVGLSTTTGDGTTRYNHATVLPAGFDPVAQGWTLFGHSPLFLDFDLRVRSDDPIPYLPAETYGAGFMAGAPALDAAGNVAFRSRPFSNNIRNGVYLAAADGTHRTVARVGDPVPGVCPSAQLT